MEAASALIRAWLILNLEIASLAMARTGLGLAVCLAALGQREPARRLLQQYQALRESLPAEPSELVLLDWLEGRIESHLGEAGAAVLRLETVRQCFFDEGKLAEAALCTIDLACAYIKLGQGDQVLPLVHDISARFPGSVDLLRILSALCGLLAAARLEEPDLDAAARRAAGLIRHPGTLRTTPPPEEN